MKPVIWFVTVACLAIAAACPAADSLPPLVDGRVPQNLNELWDGYDPQKEPLETQLVRQWQEGDVTYRYVVYTVGTFKGRKSRMAAFYAFPKHDKKLPALLHLHGGGQRAFLHAVKHAADNGYAALSINWGGREMERTLPGDANTDWGALDATQSGHNSHYASMRPDDKTLDDVESPRNNNWFLLVLAARRGITFLEQQPEVDPKRIGVFGHSMGGKLTVNVAGIDPRVKAAAPSCGGAGSITGKVIGMPGFLIRDRSKLYLNTIADNPYIAGIRCPIVYLNPTNDFNGPLDNMYYNWRKLPPETVRYSISPHLNHRHLPEYDVCKMLWFEQYLKGSFTFPQTPKLEVKLDAADGVPRAVVTPDPSKPIQRVDIYYSIDPHVLTRFWRDAGARRDGRSWVGTCPIMSVNEPLFAIANVTYKLDHRIIRERVGGVYEGPLAISSRMIAIAPEQLKEAGVKPTDAATRLIEDFSRDWHDWYRLAWLNPVHWVAGTRKLKDPKWRAPDGAELCLDVKTAKDNKLVVLFNVNDWGAFPGIKRGAFVAEKSLRSGDDWQTVRIRLDQLQETGDTDRRLTSWRHVTEFSLRGRAEIERDGRKIELGGTWQGPREFRNLRWEHK